MRHFRIEQAGEGGCETRVGRRFADAESKAVPKAERKYPVVVRTYDDDGHFAYQFGCSDWDVAEYVHDWSQADVGSTYSKAGDRGKALEPFIG